MLRLLDEQVRHWNKLAAEGAFAVPMYSFLKSDVAMDDYAQFVTLPVTYKHQVAQYSLFDRSNTPTDDVFGIFSSSGTTQEKSYYIFSKNDRRVHEEIVKNILGRIGIDKHDLGAVLAPITTGVMAHTMMWEFSIMGAGFVNCPVPLPDNISALLQSLPITAIATMPDVVFDYCKTDGTAAYIRSSKVRKLLLGGNYLSAEKRSYLETIWGAECYNLFGMSEIFGPYAGECGQHNGLHYLENKLLFEIVDIETKVPILEEGKCGAAVVTSLWHKGFPLLRYWTDDCFELTTQPCACGAEGPRLFFRGRLQDGYAIGGGHYVFPADVENILFSFGYYGEFKILYRNKGATAIMIVIEVSPETQNTDTALKTRLEDLYQAHVRLDYVPLHSIQTKEQGKIRRVQWR